jgi:hypothetical protein
LLQVGNKRLKVQHKQIRQRDNQLPDSDSSTASNFGVQYGNHFSSQQHQLQHQQVQYQARGNYGTLSTSSLPPSGLGTFSSSEGVGDPNNKKFWVSSAHVEATSLHAQGVMIHRPQYFQPSDVDTNDDIGETEEKGSDGMGLTNVSMASVPDLAASSMSSSEPTQHEIGSSETSTEMGPLQNFATTLQAALPNQLDALSNIEENHHRDQQNIGE